jgi:hypothetical protein
MGSFRFVLKSALNCFCSSVYTCGGGSIRRSLLLSTSFTFFSVMKSFSASAEICERVEFRMGKGSHNLLGKRRWEEKKKHEFSECFGVVVLIMYSNV